jgi:hypothetical protein
VLLAHILGHIYALTRKWKAFIEESDEFSRYEPKQPPSRKNLFSICLNILFQKQVAVNFPLQTYYLLYQQDELLSIFEQ